MKRENEKTEEDSRSVCDGLFMCVSTCDCMDLGQHHPANKGQCPEQSYVMEADHD